MEQAFVGVDVADAGEKRLVEKSGFYREAPVAEKRGKCLGSDSERFAAGSKKSLSLPKVFVVESAKAAGIDETEFAAAR